MPTSGLLLNNRFVFRVTLTCLTWATQLSGTKPKTTCWTWNDLWEKSKTILAIPFQQDSSGLCPWSILYLFWWGFVAISWSCGQFWVEKACAQLGMFSLLLWLFRIWFCVCLLCRLLCGRYVWIINELKATFTKINFSTFEYNKLS